MKQRKPRRKLTPAEQQQIKDIMTGVAESRFTLRTGEAQFILGDEQLNKWPLLRSASHSGITEAQAAWLAKIHAIYCSGQEPTVKTQGPKRPSNFTVPSPHGQFFVEMLPSGQGRIYTPQNIPLPGLVENEDKATAVALFLAGAWDKLMTLSGVGSPHDNHPQDPLVHDTEEPPIQKEAPQDDTNGFDDDIPF